MSFYFKVVEDGYEFFAKRQLVTLFSAPNYCGEFDNAGAMMTVDESLLCSFQVSNGNHGCIYRVDWHWSLIDLKTSWKEVKECIQWTRQIWKMSNPLFYHTHTSTYNRNNKYHLVNTLPTHAISWEFLGTRFATPFPPRSSLMLRYLPVSYTKSTHISSF